METENFCHPSPGLHWLLLQGTILFDDQFLCGVGMPIFCISSHPTQRILTILSMFFVLRCTFKHIASSFHLFLAFSSSTVVQKFPSFFFPTEWLDAQNQAFYSLFQRDDTDDPTEAEPFPQNSFILSEYSKLWPLWDALDPEQRKTEWRKRRERCMAWLAPTDKKSRKDLYAKEKRAIRSVGQNRARMEKKLNPNNNNAEKKQQNTEEKQQQLNGHADSTNSKKRKRNEQSGAKSNENASKKKRKNPQQQNGHTAAPEPQQNNLNGDDYELNRFRPDDVMERFDNRRNKLSIRQKLEMVKQKQDNPQTKQELAINAAILKAEGKRDKLNPKVLKKQLKQMKQKKKRSKDQWEKRIQDEKKEMKSRKHMKDLNRQMKKVRGRPGFEGGRHILNSVANIKKIMKGGGSAKKKGKK